MSYIPKNDLDPLIEKIETKIKYKSPEGTNKERLKVFHDFVKKFYPSKPRGKTYDQIVDDIIQKIDQHSRQVRETALNEMNEMINAMGEYAEELSEDKKKEDAKKFLEATVNEFGEIVNNLVEDNIILGPTEIDNRFKEKEQRAKEIEPNVVKIIDDEIKAAIKRLEHKESPEEMFIEKPNRKNCFQYVWRERAIHFNYSLPDSTNKAIYRKLDDFIKGYIMDQKK